MSRSALMKAYKEGIHEYKIGSACFEEGYKSGYENALENLREFINSQDDIEVLKNCGNELIDKLLKENGIEV